MSTRAEGAAECRASRGRARVHALAAVLLLGLLATTALITSGCGGPSDPEVGAYIGAWQRVVGGQPDPSQTLLVERAGDTARLTFADASGSRSGGVAMAQAGLLVMEMPAANGIIDGATSLQFSLGENGQLIVDRVLADGTTEPVWVYERGASVAPAPEP